MNGKPSPQPGEPSWSFPWLWMIPGKSLRQMPAAPRAHSDQLEGRRTLAVMQPDPCTFSTKCRMQVPSHPKGCPKAIHIMGSAGTKMGFGLRWTKAPWWKLRIAEEWLYAFPDLRNACLLEGPASLLPDGMGITMPAEKPFSCLLDLQISHQMFALYVFGKPENSLLIYICRIKKHTNTEFLNSFL